MNAHLWLLSPNITHHAYYPHKAVFEKEVDSYDCWSMFAVEGGYFEYEVRSAGKAGSGDFVICPPGVPFQRKVITPVSFHYFQFMWRTPNAHVIHDHEVVSIDKFTIRDTNYLATTYRYLRELEHKLDSFSQHWRNQLLQGIWCLYCADSAFEPTPELAGIEDPLMKQAWQYLHHYAHLTISLERLADSLKLSPVQFSRRFRAEFGITPRDYLAAIRLEKARRLLLETDDTIDQVAQLCGYQNGFYMSRVFSKKMRISPSVFRNLYRL